MVVKTNCQINHYNNEKKYNPLLAQVFFFLFSSKNDKALRRLASLSLSEVGICHE